MDYHPVLIKYQDPADFEPHERLVGVYAEVLNSYGEASLMCQDVLKYNAYLTALAKHERNPKHYPVPKKDYTRQFRVDKILEMEEVPGLIWEPEYDVTWFMPKQRGVRV